MSGTSAQLTKLTGAPLLAATRCCDGAALNTITLPRYAFRSSIAVESPHWPAYTAGTPLISTVPPKPLAAVGTVGIQSFFGASALPFTLSVLAPASNPMGPNGSVWKYPPFSPAGLRPRRLNSLAMYSVPL